MPVSEWCGDAGHLATDAFSLVVAWYAVAKARRPPNARHTYGFHRTGILVALLNAAMLVAVAVWIMVGAVGRLQRPVGVTAGPVILTALFVLLANLVVARKLAHGRDEASVRSALLHVIADAAGSAGVVLAAIVILVTGWTPADAVVSMAIAVLIATGAVALLGETIGILTEAVPRSVDAAAVERLLAGIPGVEDVHDLHIWSLDRRHHALSAHIAVADRSLAEVTALLRDAETQLCNSFGIEHATLQPECPTCVDVAPFCDLEERHHAHRAGATMAGSD